MSESAVENVTAQMANASVNDTTAAHSGATIGTGGDKPINASQNEAVLQSAAEGRRLYIGNLAYATSEGELKEFFKEYLVESTSIPVNPRTTKPVGYAFVDVSTPDEAQRALGELNGKTILDRKVSVQLARKPEEPASAEAIANGNGETAEGQGQGQARRRSSGRGRGRGRGRGGRGGRGGRANGTTNGAESTEGAAAAESAAPTNVPGQVDPLVESTNAASSAPAATSDAAPAKAPRQTRPPRQRGPPSDGVPSKTKVMVANLPYDIQEDKLFELFKEYAPVSAKIALRPIPRFMVKKLEARNEPRKGRGFAFVTLGNEELQKKAVEEVTGVMVADREIVVKVAIDSPDKQEGEEVKKENVSTEAITSGAEAIAAAS